jgi:hypothetical protein
MAYEDVDESLIADMAGGEVFLEGLVSEGVQAAFAFDQ